MAPARATLPLTRHRADQMKVAILDDYQNVALAMAEWSAVARSPDW
jgi:hypothetical protein